MENTPITPNPTITPKGPTRNTLLILSVLLVLSVLFWLWSLAYRNDHQRDDRMDTDGKAMMNNNVNDENNTNPGVVEETNLDNEIDASMNSESEVELKGIDEEF